MAREALVTKYRGDEAFFEMQEVLPRLWIGGTRCARDVQALTAAGVSHILVTNYDRPWNPDVFEYMELELDDHPDENLLELFEETNAFIREGRKSGSVLVHCTLGRSRSASFVLAFLIGDCHMSFDEAYTYLKGKRSYINPNAGFVEQLHQYERACREKWEACPLCKLEVCSEWLDSSDPRFTVLMCDSCDLPMIVWRHHTMEIGEADGRDMTEALDNAVSAHGMGSGYLVDKIQRTIPDHLHWHIRDDWLHSKL